MRTELVYIAAITLFLAGAILPGMAAEDLEEQQQVVQKFLHAYVKQDITAVRQCVPTKVENVFGPYPFKGVPKLGPVKVDEKQAIIDFTATIEDKKFPAKGGLLMRKQDGTWYARQVLFYDKVPGLLRLPTKSVTKEDARQEPKVKEIGTAFINAWRNNDKKKMMTLWYNWTKVDKEPVKELSLSNLSMDNAVTIWKEPFFKYSAKLTYRFGFLSYSMNFKGGLVMVKEDDAWKVRANELIFDL